MRLIVGGISQGKLDYALRAYGISPSQVTEVPEEAEHARIWNHLERTIRKWTACGENPQAHIDRVLNRNPDLIVICDEVGCGVVPVAPEERLWREAVGRTCCTLAERAETVERVFCGISMKLKE